MAGKGEILYLFGSDFFQSVSLIEFEEERRIKL